MQFSDNCNFSEMFNNGNMYQYSNPVDDVYCRLGSKNLSKIQRWFNGPVFIWSSQKAWLSHNQSSEPENDDNPELKIKLQVNIEKADITVTSILEISSNWVSIRKIMAIVANLGCKYMDKEDILVIIFTPRLSEVRPFVIICSSLSACIAFVL